MEFTKQELEKYNGNEANPTYVAANGKVYDVSDSKLWKNGKHMNRHEAGTELGDAFGAAPHGPEVLERFKQVGELKVSERSESLPVPGFIARFIQKYPFFKRHPHPMVVHFPMTFYITSSLFLLWYYLVSPMIGMLDAIIYMHVLGTISIPVAILTGWLSWKVNYLGKPMKPIKWKISLSFLIIVLNFIVLAAMLQNPMVLADPAGWELLLPAIVFSYLPVVSIIGYHGGQLVY